MFDEEFERLTKNSNQLLRINSFFSTSKNKQIALEFAISNIDENNKRQKAILFDIEINKIIDKRNLNLIDLGNILKDIGNDKKAEKYYFQLLYTLNDNDPHIQRCLHNIGILAYQKSDFPLALEKHLECLNIKLLFLDAKDSKIAASKVNIGIVYRRMKQYQKAIDSLKEALDIQRETLRTKHPEIAITFYNMGLINEELHDYNQASDNYTAATEIFPETHPYMRRVLEALCRIELKIKQV